MTSGRRALDATHVLATLGLSPPCPKRTLHDYAGPCRYRSQHLAGSQISRVCRKSSEADSSYIK